MDDKLRYPGTKLVGDLKGRYNILRKEYLSKAYTGQAGLPENNNTQISIAHIGGRGDLGPSGAFQGLGPHSKYVIFEADLDEKDPETRRFNKRISQITDRGCTVSLKEACIGGQCSKREFHINAVQTSNSLLPIDPKAGKFQTGHMGYWGLHAKEVRKMVFDTVTIDSLREKEDFDIHFMVLDVQGAELEILEGSSSYLESDLLGVVLEVEMYPIYKDQPLFHDTFSFLNDKGLDFFGFWNGKLQSWHPYIGLGNGRRIVGEAVYFKNLGYLIKTISEPRYLVIQLLRLARLFFCMRYDSHGLEVMSYVTQKYPEIVKEFSQVPYIKDQLELWNIVNEEFGCWPELKYLEENL
jgi:FkbM family methyltransferase